MHYEWIAVEWQSPSPTQVWRWSLIYSRTQENGQAIKDQNFFTGCACKL